MQRCQSRFKSISIRIFTSNIRKHCYRTVLDFTLAARYQLILCLWKAIHQLKHYLTLYLLSTLQALLLETGHRVPRGKHSSPPQHEIIKVQACYNAIICPFQASKEGTRYRRICSKKCTRVL